MTTEISKMQKEDIFFHFKLYRLVRDVKMVKIINERIKDIQDFRQKSDGNQCTTPSISRSYSLDEVRNISLEYRNACMHGHSHKLTRFELKAELRKIDEKHGLDYKEGVDYNFA